MAGEGRFLFRLEKTLTNPRALLVKIGAMVTSRTMRRFADQTDPDGDAWEDRAVPNIPGIIDDLQRGSSIKSSRFLPRPVLQDYGRLMQSIQWQLRTQFEVEIGTNVPYADIHQSGLERTMEVPLKVKHGLMAWFGTAEGQMWEPSLAWLLDVDNIDFRVRKREFIGISDDDAQDIRQIIIDGLISPGPGGTVSIS